jgi:hypothetical protein
MFPFIVIPAKVGIQLTSSPPGRNLQSGRRRKRDSRFRGNDEKRK